MTTFEFAPRSGQDATPADVPRERPEPFHIAIEPDRARTVVVPCGELDMATVDRLGACIDGLLDAGFDAIVLDLRQLRFLDSTGLHLIVQECRRSDATIQVIDGPPQVARLFDLTGVRDALNFTEP